MSYPITKTPKEIRDLWRTPPEIFRALRCEFPFYLDVCASKSNALTTRFITEEIDCLNVSWQRYFPAHSSAYAWCNPPYSNPLPFIQKAAQENTDNSIGVVMLLPADTSVKWFSEAAKTASEVRFITNGRLQFLNAGTGKPVNGNTKGSMLIIWHPWPRTHLQFSTVERDKLMEFGRKGLEAKHGEAA
ncbi:phage N-6-adenine-methyltransferase [Pectobacterium aroidearum]|uniref:phage N-6-adenine-methyltransferase n=1 Tax=Pectobacterium aroidearum TaxID=1201031 RepID=UPI003019D284